MTHARTTRRLQNLNQVGQDIFLPEETTTDATPIVVYTSGTDIPENRVLEIIANALVITTDGASASSIQKRGLYRRPTGGNLTLVDSAASSIIGELLPNRADIVFGVTDQRFTISIRGRAGATYLWTPRIEVIRNN